MHDLLPLIYYLKFQNSVSNGSHNLTMLCFNMSYIATITVKSVDYRCTNHDVCKSKAINLLENSILEDRGYI